MISINDKEKEVLIVYLKDLQKPKELNFLLNTCVNTFNFESFIPVDLVCLSKLKEKYINNLVVLFMVSDNKFIFLESLKYIIERKFIIPSQIIFFEHQSLKIEEWIRTELPIFYGLPIYNIFNMNENLCRLEWRKDEKKIKR